MMRWNSDTKNASRENTQSPPFACVIVKEKTPKSLRI